MEEANPPRQKTYVVKMAVDVPSNADDAARFRAGVKKLFKECPHIRVTIYDSPEIIIEAETEDELRDYVQRLTYLTEYGTDRGG
jgi:hypothetical protein